MPVGHGSRRGGTVEAWTPDGRRRSDVAVTLPGGRRLALEVQRGTVSDTEWLARHADYARAGITEVWLWGHASRAVFPMTFDCWGTGLRG